MANGSPAAAAQRPIDIKTQPAQRLRTSKRIYRGLLAFFILLSFLGGVMVADAYYNLKGKRLFTSVSIDFLGPLVISPERHLMNAKQDASTETLHVVAAMLNVRRGPGTNFEIVDVLKKEETLQATRHNDDWYQIDYGRFVHRKGISAENPRLAQVSYQRFYVVEPFALVRSEPDAAAKPTARLTYGESILGRYENDDWLRLDGGGFLMRRRVDRLAPLTEAEKPFLAKVTGTRVAIVDQPKAPFQRKGVVFRDRKVKVVAIKRGWAQIGDGLYIKARYLEKM